MVELAHWSTVRLFSVKCFQVQEFFYKSSYEFTCCIVVGFVVFFFSLMMYVGTKRQCDTYLLNCYLPI